MPAEATVPTEKMYLRSTRDRSQTVTAQYNPNEFTEKIKVNYATIKIPGLSHAPLQFSNTDNWKVSFDLWWYSHNQAELDASNKARRLLQSWTIPDQAQNVEGGPPPRILVVWPQLLSVICVIREVDFTHKLFSRNGQSYHRICKVNFEEIRDARLYGFQVRNDGTMRGA